MKNPNFLILDEPTNDLDINTLNTLEEFLENFQGCLVIVSHDRYFMDKLVDHLLIFEGEGRVKDFNGNYTDYKDAKQEEEQAVKEKTKAAKDAPAEIKPKTGVAQVKRKPSFSEKREYEILEKEIANLEVKKAELEANLASGNGKKEDFKAWAEELKQTTEMIDKKAEKWMVLGEIVG